MSKLLDNIQGPEDLRKLDLDRLKELAQEIRDCITSRVSQTGGHLASNLGVVELTIALHFVFDLTSDRLLWDVGHQCYAHKLITGRREQFVKLRQAGGASGFPNPDESICDPFIVGHAGTAVATALGMALGAQHVGSSEKIIACVGDASIVNGLSFEALNNLGLVKRQMLIVLNDNSMAIDVTQGAVARFLSRVRLSHTYEDMRKKSREMLEQMGSLGRTVEDAVERIKKSLRMTVTPSHLFEALNIPYFGPVDGHDLGEMIETFQAMKDMPHPVLLHVYTKKGMGFVPADNDPARFHSTGPFEVNGDGVETPPVKRTFTDAFSDAILEIARENDKVVAITAAMADGTGLKSFAQEFPDRFYDIGIAESVAVDIAAGMARKGLRPVVCIYSTFMQRSFDQIFHDVCLQNLPVVFCADRAGFVGVDGPTHHGMLDIGYFRMLPNMCAMAPSDEGELRKALRFAMLHDKPVVIRYPREPVLPVAQEGPRFELGKCRMLKQSRDAKVALVAYGVMAAAAMKAAAVLDAEGIDVDVVDARFAKPIDTRIVDMCFSRTVITLEDHSIAAGFGSALLEEAHQAAVGTGRTPRVVTLGGPDCFVPHAARDAQLENAGLDAASIVAVVRRVLAALPAA
ncbi:MAG TPA: 1-deoxy-D-xylulose-5-phosphate synthase [Sedimentisphaerales bacterium]|nr:1-deoxy-D-xylulose-5-phosphate synthase [Sedimentisphaerales bacterium]